MFAARIRPAEATRQTAIKHTVALVTFLMVSTPLFPYPGRRYPRRAHGRHPASPVENGCQAEKEDIGGTQGESSGEPRDTVSTSPVGGAYDVRFLSRRHIA